AAKLSRSGSPSKTPPAVLTSRSWRNSPSDGMYQYAVISAAMAAAIAVLRQWRRASQIAGRKTKNANVHFVSIPRPATTPNTADHFGFEKISVLSKTQMATATIAVNQ